MSKPNYIAQKIFDIDLVAIPKSKVTLKFNKSAYVGMCIVVLSKVLMHEFQARSRYFFRAAGVFLKLVRFGKHSPTTRDRKVSQEKNIRCLSGNSEAFHLKMRNFTHR